MNALLSISRGKVFAIVPTPNKPAVPVVLAVTELNADRCIVRLRPDELRGASGFKSSGKEDRWAYEVQRSGLNIEFGRTSAEVNTLEDGSIQIVTTEPLRALPVRKPKKARSPKVEAAVQAIMKLPAPEPKTRANVLELGWFVKSINSIKDQLPDLELKIGPNGKLIATLEYS